jgi:MFS transporter, MFS domain-containing protein family, molybdate-anion transporter
MGAQKGRIVDDGVRANIYGVLRIPLNIFVVVAPTTTTEGGEHRDRVFVFCGGLLLAASVGAGWLLEDGILKGAIWER